jgi:hypothetical protein
MNNKIMPLMESGTRQNIFDINNQSVEEVSFRNIDIYAYTVKEEVLVLYKDGSQHLAKPGDTIIKSHCRGICFIDSTNYFKDILLKLEQIEIDRKEKESLNIKERSACEPDCISSIN